MERVNPLKARCENCFFWREAVDPSNLLPVNEIFGKCHRYPPQADPHGWGWPTTHKNDYCGELRLRHPTERDRMA